MARRGTIAIIRHNVGLNAALQHVQDIAAGSAVVFERGVLYPYFAFQARCTVSTLIGQKELSFDSVVDAINGHGATADQIVSETINVTDEMRLQAEISEDDAKRIARRTVTHRLGKKLRMIAPFDVQLDSAETIYKRFWVFRVGASRVMVDSVTGSTCPLNAAAA